MGRQFTARYVWQDSGVPVADCALDEHYDHGVPQQVGDVVPARADVPALVIVQRVWADAYTADLLVRPWGGR